MLPSISHLSVDVVWGSQLQCLGFSYPLMTKCKRIYTFRYGRILYYLDKAPMMITIAYLRQHQVWPMKLRFFFGFCCPQGKKMWWGCCPQWVDIFQKFHSHFGNKLGDVMTFEPFRIIQQIQTKKLWCISVRDD